MNETIRITIIMYNEIEGGKKVNYDDLAVASFHTTIYIQINSLKVLSPPNCVQSQIMGNYKRVKINFNLKFFTSTTEFSNNLCLEVEQNLFPYVHY